jgi:hypothetical protein
MRITIYYINKYDSFNFIPFVSDIVTAKVKYLNLIWNGYKAVQIRINSWSEPEKIIWETKRQVFPTYDDSADLPF